MSISRLGSNSMEEVRRTKHLQVGVLKSWTGATEGQTKFVATQTILKMDKRLGKHFSLQ